MSVQKKVLTNARAAISVELISCGTDALISSHCVSTVETARAWCPDALVDI